MSDVQVTCVSKPDRTSPHEHITHLGGASWYWKVEDVIYSIECRTNSFFTYVDGVRADVNVRSNPRTTRKYVQTSSDGVWINNLLALYECRR